MSRSVWGAPIAVEVDGRRIGVRADGPESSRWLAELLAEYVVDDPDVPANYSVRVATDPGDLNLLYWGGCLVARSRDESGLVAAIADHLGGHGTPPDGVVRFAGSVIHDGSSGVVLTSVDYVLASKVEARLRDRGLQVLTSPWVDVDATARRIRCRSSLHLGDAPTRSVPESLELATLGVAAPIGDSGSLADLLMSLAHRNVLRPSETDLNAAVELLRSSEVAEISGFAVSELVGVVRDSIG